MGDLSDDREPTAKLNCLYKHYKGDLYQVLLIGQLSEARDVLCVVYKSWLYPTRIWIRPLAMWRETVQWPDGSWRPRFELSSRPALEFIGAAKRIRIEPGSLDALKEAIRLIVGEDPRVDAWMPHGFLAQLTVVDEDSVNAALGKTEHEALCNLLRIIV